MLKRMRAFRRFRQAQKGPSGPGLRRGAFLLAALLCLMVAGPAHGEEGRIPIFEPTTISAPGSYVVTRDIASVGTVITILGSAENVWVDLNGFTLSVSNQGSVIDATGLKSLTVTNGTLQRTGAVGGTTGLDVQETEQLTVEHVTFNPGYVYGQDVTSFTIKNNLFPLDGGIVFEEPGSPTIPQSGAIEGNVLATGLIKIESQVTNRGANSLVRHNHIAGGSFWAIRLTNQDNCVISDNRIRGHQGNAISVTASHSRISDNLVSGCGKTGIDVYGDFNVIKDNVSSLNGQLGDPNEGNGIRVRGNRNHIEGNTTDDNARAGLFINSGSGNTYSRNVARGNVANPGGGACANPAITTCPAPYGTGSSAPDLCDNAAGSTTFCDNLMPGPPRS